MGKAALREENGVMRLSLLQKGHFTAETQSTQRIILM
jgi:hypothetical protein